MKKHFLLVSMITALLLTSCGNTNSQGDNSGDNSSRDASQESSQNNSSESSSSSSSSWVDPYVPPEAQTVANDNFTINIPADLSSMSANCKKYVDDMKAQQRRLLAERGAEADYYLNDLYGDKGVDLTKGVVPSSGNYQDNTGGYRDGKTQNDYLDAVGADYTKGEKSDENKGITITFAPSSALDNKEYTVTYGKKEDLSDAVTFTTNEKSVNLKNLLVNQKYYFKVSADNKESKLASFTTGDYPRWIDARPMFNVRDMGGYMTSSGQRIKQGMIYRGGEINAKTGWYGTQRYTDDTGNSQARDGHIVSQTEDSKKAFREDMGMVNGLEIDLRSSGETNGYPSKSGYCNFAENNDISYKLIGISSYANGMKNNTSQIKQLFEAFAQADQHPVYYHCYGGADRTGVVGFMLGAVLGMSYTDLVIDFELTSYSSNPSRNYRSHLRNGPWNEWPGMVEYLQNTLGWERDGAPTKTIKQGMEDYLKNNCRIIQTTIDTIRNIMLEPAK